MDTTVTIYLTKFGETLVKTGLKYLIFTIGWESSAIIFLGRKHFDRNVEKQEPELCQMVPSCRWILAGEKSVT